jgi:hypothetical protein
MMLSGSGIASAPLSGNSEQEPLLLTIIGSGGAVAGSGTQISTRYRFGRGGAVCGGVASFKITTQGNRFFVLLEVQRTLVHTDITKKFTMIEV